jgi:hypothetical protein
MTAEHAARVRGWIAAIEAVQARVKAAGGWLAEADATYYELGTAAPSVGHTITTRSKP